MQNIRSPQKRYTYCTLLIAICILFASGCTSRLQTPEIGSWDIFDTLLILPAAPEKIELNPETNTLYIAYRKYPYLTVVDQKKLQIVASIPLPKSSHRIGINSVQNQIYVTNKQKGTISVINGTTNTLMTELKVGKWPNSIAVNAKTNTMYVTDEKRAAVYVIDGETKRVSSAIPVGRKPRGIAVNPTKNLVYVANWQDDTVSIIDGDTLQILDNLLVGSHPTVIEVDPELNKAFISNLDSNNVYVIDGGEYHAVVGVIPVQDEPYGLTIDTQHNWLFVTNTLDHSISVIQNRSHREIKTFPTKYFPIDVAVDPKKNMLYVIHRDQPALFVAQIILE